MARKIRAKAKSLHHTQTWFYWDLYPSCKRCKQYGKYFLVSSNAHMTHSGLLYTVRSSGMFCQRARQSEKVLFKGVPTWMFSQTLLVISGLICSQNTASLIAFSPMIDNDLQECEYCWSPATSQGRAGHWEGEVNEIFECMMWQRGRVKRGWKMGLGKISGSLLFLSRYSLLSLVISLGHVLCILRNNSAKVLLLKASLPDPAVWL